jgi:hypothetical protein
MQQSIWQQCKNRAYNFFSSNTNLELLTINQLKVKTRALNNQQKILA